MEGKLVKDFCHNCKKDVIAYRDEKGASKYLCRHCGAVNVSKKMTRRMIRIEVIAPPGEEVM